MGVIRCTVVYYWGVVYGCGFMVLETFSESGGLIICCIDVSKGVRSKIINTWLGLGYTMMCASFWVMTPLPLCFFEITYTTKNVLAHDSINSIVIS